MADSFGVFVDAWRYHWKDILRNSVQGARQYPTGDFWADVSGVDAAIEGIIATSEGDYSDAAIAGSGVFLGKLKAAKSGLSLLRDSTGKVHGALPRIDQLKRNLSTDQVRETMDELRGSILTRKQELQRLGEHGPHRARIAEEESLLRSLEKYLEDVFGAQ